MDVNKSGALYVSYGQDDAARYIKNLGSTLIGKIFRTAHYNIQHISVKDSLKIPSDDFIAKETAKLLKKNPKLLKEFEELFYSLAYNSDASSSLTTNELDEIINNPKSKNSVKLTYSVSSLLGDPNYANESKVIYDHFRKLGYDAIPDLHDVLSGTSSTAMIIINPHKLIVTSTTYITKDIMRDAKIYVKSLEKLKVNELIE